VGGLVFQAADHVGEEVHVHETGNQVFFGQFGEDFHYFYAAERRFIVKATHKEFKEFGFGLCIDLLGSDLLF